MLLPTRPRPHYSIEANYLPFYRLVFSSIQKIKKYLYFLHRLREYEVEVDQSTGRGPDVERVYFVIIEMARKFIYPPAFFSSQSKHP